MASIDERVVAMSFENARFEAGVATTMASLQKLSDSLAKTGTVTGFSEIDKAAGKVTLEAPMTALDKLKARLGFGADTKTFADIQAAGDRITLEAPMTALDKLKAKVGLVSDTKGFADIEAASEKVTFRALHSSLDSVAAKFSVIEGAAAVALGNIVTKATMAGAEIVKSLSLDPILGGFKEYETNLGSIQTILANTEGQKGAGLKPTNEALAELNEYSDKTIYNFSEMAKNIGTFTAAGLDLDTSTKSIKGIANLAALSGSNSQQAATAMYQLSQALAAGKVGATDWNSVVNAGMGGAVFQKALVKSGLMLGTLDDTAVSLDEASGAMKIYEGSFRESIMSLPGAPPSWLTGEVLSTTLKNLSGDLTEAQIKAQGFTDEQAKAIFAQSQSALKAATNVKTLSALLDTTREAVGSGWAETWQIIFGDFGEAKTLFTGLAGTISGFVGDMSDARNAMLDTWKELGGRDDLIKGIQALFEGLFSIIEPIQDAFRDIFPKTTGEDLAELTERFREFAETLKIGPETADALKRTFRGFFAVLHIGVEVVKGILGVIGDLLGMAGKGSGGFLNFTGSIGDFLVAVDQAVTQGGALTGFFDGLSAILQVPMDLIMGISEAIFGLFEGSDGGGAEKFGDSMAGLSDKLGPIKTIIEALSGAWEGLVDILSDVRDAVSPWLSEIAEEFLAFGDVVADAFENANWDAVFAALQTGLLGGILLAIKKALGGGVDLSGGALDSLTKLFGALTGNLTAMQKNLQAGTLLKIAAAIAVLAAGVLVLSLIDPDKLTRAMTAVAIGLGQLVGALALLSKFSGGAAFLTMPLIAASLIGLATAVTILAGAVTLFSLLTWDEMIRGLTGVAGALVAVGGASKLLSPNMIPGALALIPLAIAINILAIAVKSFAELSWEELATGLVGVAGALVAVGASMLMFGPSTLLVGPGLVGVAFGMTLLAAAVGVFASMDLLKMTVGIIGMGAALAAIGLAIALIPPTVGLQAAGLVLLGIALTGIAGAIKMMGSMDVVKLVKGIAAIGGVLVVLGLGLTAMAGTLPGSIALLAAAAALAILAPTLALLGNLEWETIIRGLGAISLALGVLAIAGLVASGPISALGIALLPLAGVLVVTAGAVYIFAKAMSLLGEEGTKGIAVMVAAITAFVALLPKIIIDFVKGLVEIIAAVAEVAPKVVDAIVKILDSIIQVVIQSAPQLALAIGVLLDAFIKVVGENAPKIMQAGIELLLTFLSGIAANIGQIVTQVTTIITNFVDALAAQAPTLIASGANLLATWLKGIGDNITKVVSAAIDAVTKFIGAVVSKLPEVLGLGVQLVLSFVTGLIGQMGKVINAGVELISKLIVGIGNAVSRVVTKATEVAGKIVSAIADGLVKLVDTGFNAMIDMMNGLADVIRRRNPELRAAGWNIADAIIDGLVDGLGDLAGKAVEGVTNLFGSLPGAAKKVLGIKSPSKVFQEIGENTMLGFAKGIEAGGEDTEKTMAGSTQSLVDTAAKTMGTVPDLIGEMVNLDPVITPVLDLSQVEKDSGKLTALTTRDAPISLSGSYGSASAISSEKASVDEQKLELIGAMRPTVNFEQNNYSPEALSDVEIYRQTKNQVAQFKTAMGFTSDSGWK